MGPLMGVSMSILLSKKIMLVTQMISPSQCNVAPKTKDGESANVCVLTKV